jgi:predicted ArsR family transcriptional regulator
MPPQLTQDQREQITAALFRREDAKEIADANGISERQVRRIAQNLKQYGTVTAPRLKKMGRPTCLNKEIEDVGALLLCQQRQLIRGTF